VTGGGSFLKYPGDQCVTEVGMDSRIERLSIEIETLRKAVERLQKLGNDFPALDRNLQRISASVKMLELNFVDPVKFDG
jgi:hypothetical protein